MRSRGGQHRAGPTMALVALLALTAGCGGGGSEEAMSGSGGSVAEGGSAVVDGNHARGGRAGDAAAPARRAGPKAGGDSGAHRPMVSTRAVIRRGEVVLATKEMNRARAEIEDLLGRHGGYLASEDTSNDRDGRPESSVLVLRVPEPAFDTVMDALTDVGRPTHTERSSEDVTSQLIDVDSRVATQEASLARLQRFLRQATNVEDMIRVESEIAERQAELESLQAQQKYLRDHTTLSTVTVRLRTPAAAPPSPAQQGGFLLGLDRGWDALRWVLLGAATVLGAMLPFLAAVAPLGVPVWLLARTRSRRRGAPASHPPAADAG
jgi:hypothetical protein